MGGLRFGDEGRRPELLLELVDGPKKIALDRPDGQAETRGDVFEHEIVVMTEEEDGLFLGRDLFEGPGDPVLELARFQGRAGIGGAAAGQPGVGADRGPVSYTHL